MATDRTTDARITDASIAPGADAPGASAVVEVTYYTDPLCCWSWAFEPQWRRLRYEYGGRLGWHYRMGGLLPGWDRYSDPLNDVSRPAHMGPLWLQAHHISGQPIDARIWVEDPPASSFPSCLAVKAAGFQSDAAAEHYLRRLREAVMLERRNIARPGVLHEIAHELAEADPHGFDAVRFAEDLSGKAARDAFREDLRDVQYRGIGRFPTLTLRGQAGGGVMIVGYRPYDALRDALGQVAPGLSPSREAPEPAAYTARRDES